MADHVTEVDGVVEPFSPTQRKKPLNGFNGFFV
jgi:hypothetical protein